jgi:hypothetical protein
MMCRILHTRERPNGDTPADVFNVQVVCLSSVQLTRLIRA